MHYKNNWIKISPDLKIIFPNVSVDSFYNELLKNAAQINDEFPNQLELFFSGGVNSQLVLRSYHTLGIPIKVSIVRYENNFNINDVSAAIKICEELGVSYRVIDFKLQEFFENDADEIFKKSNTIDLKKLPLLKALEQSDGIPIIGNRDPYIYRSSYYYDRPADWLLKIVNEDFVFQRYSLGKPVVGDWFFYSPEVVLSFINTPQIKQLVNDQLSNRLSSVSSRISVYRNIWNDFTEREKKSGFEKQGAVFLYPDFMAEFFKEHMSSVALASPQEFQISSLTIDIVIPTD